MIETMGEEGRRKEGGGGGTTGLFSSNPRRPSDVNTRDSFVLASNAGSLSIALLLKRGTESVNGKEPERRCRLLSGSLNAS